MVDRAAEAGVLTNATDGRTIRVVTHLNVDDADIDRAIEVLAEAA